MVIIVCGLPGSGKTFFAVALARRLGAIYISSDEVRFTKLKNRTYSVAEKKMIYDEMLIEMRSVMHLQDVVLDATFYKEAIRTDFIKAAVPNRTVIIEIRASENVCRARVRLKRQQSEADEQVYDMIKSQWEPIRQDHLVLDSSTGDIETMEKTAIQYIQRV